MDLVVLGYLLHDVLDVDGQIKHCLGGVSAYASLAALKLGLSVGIVSKVGGDFKYFNELKGIDLSGVSKQELTTVFFNTYRKGIRTQKVANIGESICPKGIPADYLKAKAIHLGPVFNEISPETMRFLRENTNAFITLDPQGFLRSSQNGLVLSKKLDFSLLGFVDLVKVSEKDCSREEIEAMKQKCPLVVVTRGKNGSTVFSKGKAFSIPFFRAKRLVDETGAGDVFMAGFIKEWLSSQDAEKAALFGSAAASFAVEDFGVNGIGSLEEINGRIMSCLTGF
ncbi:MAG: PfkB family carbohydrate kinase [archaeon]